MSGASGSWDNSAHQTPLEADPTAGGILYGYLKELFTTPDSVVGDISTDVSGTVKSGVQVVTQTAKYAVQTAVEGVAAGIGIPSWLLYLVVGIAVLAFMAFYFKLA